MSEKIKGKYYLAIDIGASSGRHILGHLENGKLCIEEIYRFPNGAIQKDGHLVWDIDGLFENVLIGMEKCREAERSRLLSALIHGESIMSFWIKKVTGFTTQYPTGTTEMIMRIKPWKK